MIINSATSTLEIKPGAELHRAVNGVDKVVEVLKNGHFKEVKK